ncbi:ribosome maturation factor RimP [Arthrobacter russicus]|jgi:ribosome maturation factor RimP|uniref:Ribosome maturation factor RimP n=1 Tax=Arthrobacter russicus TaxID=172040 RepID=A0ABU1JFU9_9MICC|nr:ribosome maturation factor RimP [Arthrobacter russicus]MDR6270721.1 ribosome maturation factor RimP [Arthrobacter russicus]
MSKPDRPQNPVSSTAAEAQRLRELLQPTVEENALFLEDVSIHVAGTHRTVHVAVDLPEDQPGSVSLDAIASISQLLSAVLDADPADDGRPYDLEVSSPGVSRPLTEPRHWRRATGHLVTLKLVKGSQSDLGELITGRLVEVAESGVTVRPELPVKKGMKPKQGDPEFIEFVRIRKGTVEVEFTRLDEAEEVGTVADQKGQD